VGGAFVGGAFVGGAFVGGAFVGGAFVGGAFVGGAFVGGGGGIIIPNIYNKNILVINWKEMKYEKIRDF
jgi:hypothetical protein